MLVFGRGENRSTRRKISRSRVENQQTQSTYDAESGNRTRDTLVEDERSHHYANPVPHENNNFPLLCNYSYFPGFESNRIESRLLSGNTRTIARPLHPTLLRPTCEVCMGCFKPAQQDRPVTETGSVCTCLQ